MENQKKNTVILFQGDSISDGNRYKDPIARGDLNHQIGHSYVYIIAGEWGLKYADKNIAFVNRGQSGDTLENVFDRREEDIFAENPDIVSILVGVNDYWIWKEDHDHTEEYEEIYRQLLDEILEKNPQAKIVLCEPFVLPVVFSEEEYKGRRRMVEEEIEALKRISKDYNTLYVPLQKKFDDMTEVREAKYWIWDGVHPTEAGHALIAQEWMKVVLESGILGFDK